MSIKSFFQTNGTLKIVTILATLLVILLVFQAGFWLGNTKGEFTRNWDMRYSRGFKDSRSPFFGMMQKGDNINPHGTVGEIISLNLPKLIVKGPNQAEEVINLNTETVIRKHRNSATTSDLSIGKNVVVIGEPNNQGEIEAKLIRIMPEPGEYASTTPNNFRGMMQWW